jgi:spore germination protein KA
MKSRLLKRTSKNKKKNTHDENRPIDELLEQCKLSSDFISFRYSEENPYYIHYFKTLINFDVVHQHILPFICDENNQSLFDLQTHLPIGNTEIIEDVNRVQHKLMTGSIAVEVKGNIKEILLIDAISIEKRPVSVPEVEFSVLGPKEAFVESIDANLNLVRKRLPIPELITQEIVVGNLSKTRVAVIHIQDVADPDNVQTIVQRIKDIDFDNIADSSTIAQIISDNHNSPFPQMIDTERPDRVVGVLSEGKITVLVDGSPHALTGPTTLIEFFSAFEDYFLSWHLATIFRLIRLFAVFFSVVSTALYVAVLTYHYDMIPQNLLNPLIASRSGVPFPPIFEAIILELTIELLREAGARLPTKIGQTIGIVGGIVIGTAAVQAGLTSNVLLIIVALAALASFTTPVYQMGNVIRLIRFPFLLSAQFFGLLGVAFCFALFLSHLLKLSSLGRPYLAPVYPLRLVDLKDSLFRLPLYFQSKRPLQLRSNKPARFNNKHHDKKKKDIEH